MLNSSTKSAIGTLPFSIFNSENTASNFPMRHKLITSLAFTMSPIVIKICFTSTTST